MNVFLDGHKLREDGLTELWLNRLTGKYSTRPFFLLRGWLYKRRLYRVRVERNILEIDPPPQRNAHITAVYETSFDSKDVLTRHDWRMR